MNFHYQEDKGEYFNIKRGGYKNVYIIITMMALCRARKLS